MARLFGANAKLKMYTLQLAAKDRGVDLPDNKPDTVDFCLHTSSLKHEQHCKGIGKLGDLTIEVD